jgi:hypothetical protein
MRAPIRYPQFFAVPPFEPPAKELRHLLLERLGRGRRRAASAFVGCISGLGGSRVQQRPTAPPEHAIDSANSAEKALDDA